MKHTGLVQTCPECGSRTPELWAVGECPDCEYKVPADE